MTSVLFRSLLVTSALLPLSACKLGIHNDDETVTLQVDSYKQQCDDDSANLCFRIRDDENDDWRLWTGPFTEFDGYQWGYIYTLNVVVSYQSGGDAPESYRYESTVRRDSVTGNDQSFTLDLYTDTGILAQISTDTWNIGNEQDFSCADDCDDIAAVVAEQQIGSFEFRAVEGELTLTSVLCSTGDTDEFNDDCSGKSTENWFTAQFLSDCGFTVPQLCLLYRVNESDPFELLQLEDGIEGFTPAWGSREDIDVVRTISGGGNITAVELDSENTSSSALGSAWSFLFIVRGEALDSSSNGQIGLYDSNITLDCASFSLCDRLDNRIRDEEYLLLEAYVESADVTVITGIVCDDSTYGVFADCVAEQDTDDDFNWPI